MNKLAVHIANFIIKRGVINKEEYNVYLYGLQVGLEVSIAFIVSLIISIFFHVIKEFFLFMLIFFPLRSYAGGFHLDHYISCFICSVLFVCGILLLVTNLEVPFRTSIILFFASVILIKLLAPVNDINRPVSEGEAKHFNKRLNLTLGILTVLLFFFYFMQMGRLIFLEGVTVFFMVGVLGAGHIKNKWLQHRERHAFVEEGQHE